MAYDLNKITEWIYNNLNNLNVDIIKFDEKKITVKCKVCDSIRELNIDSLYSNYYNSVRQMHGDSCSKYYNNIGKKELGDKIYKKFKESYRFAHERCCNPNCKDYNRYKGKMKFVDYVDYFKCCYDNFKYAINKYGIDSKLSIDRIDGNKGYEKGNVRFVPILINLKNKDIVIPVIGVNINTLEVIQADSVNELCTIYFDENKVSAIAKSIKENRFYNNVWKIFYKYKIT